MEGRRQARDLVHDLRRVLVVHRVAQRIGEQLGDLPVLVAGERLHHLAHRRDAALGVGEGAVLLEEARTRQEDVRELGGLVEEQVLDDDALHGAQRSFNVLGVGVGLDDVLTFAIERLEGTVHRRFEHIGDAQARLVVQGDTPRLAEQRAGGGVRHVAVTRQFVREGAHVAGALDVVLAAQRVHAHTLTAEVAGGHGKVGDADHHGRALAVLGDAQSVIDCTVATGGKQPRGAAHLLGRHAGGRLHGFRRVLRLTDEVEPDLEGITLAALSNEGFVDQAFGGDDVRQRIDDRHIGAGLELEVIVGPVVRARYAFGDTRVDHDQLGALAQATLHLRGEHRVASRGVGTDDHDHVRLEHRVKRLSSGRLAEGLLETVTGRRVADAGAGVDVVVAKRGTHQLLHQIAFLVGAAAGDDAADRVLAVLALDALDLAGGVVDRLVPAHFLPCVVDALADHRRGDAVLVGGIAEREAPLDAAVTVVGVAVLVRHQAHHLITLSLGLERAAHTTIRTGGDGALLGLAVFDHRLLHQRGSRAGLHAGAAAHAFGVHERLVHAR